jgi:hypothetical protein
MRYPHDDSTTETLVRESSGLPEDVAESRDRLRSIVARTEQAGLNRDFATARLCADQQRIERDKLRLLYEKRGLSGWMFE